MEEDETIYSLTMIIPFGFIVQISNEDLKVFSGKKKEESLFHKKERKKPLDIAGNTQTHVAWSFQTKQCTGTGTSLSISPNLDVSPSFCLIRSYSLELK